MLDKAASKLHQTLISDDKNHISFTPVNNPISPVADNTNLTIKPPLTMTLYLKLSHTCHFLLSYFCCLSLV